MSYSKNPYLPKVRVQAVSLVKQGKSVRLSARHFGVHASTVSRWVKKAGLADLLEIPTLSSRPKNPKTISREISDQVKQLRRRLTCQKITKKLNQAGVTISLSSVKRIIRKK